MLCTFYYSNVDFKNPQIPVLQDVEMQWLLLEQIFRIV